MPLMNHLKGQKLLFVIFRVSKVCDGAGISLQPIAGKFCVLWRCLPKRARAFVVACKSTSNSKAATCLRQRLRAL